MQIMNVLFTEEIKFTKRTFKKGEFAQVEVSGTAGWTYAFIKEEGEVVASLILSEDYTNKDGYIISNKSWVLEGLHKLLRLPEVVEESTKVNLFVDSTDKCESIQLPIDGRDIINCLDGVYSHEDLEPCMEDNKSLEINKQK